MYELKIFNDEMAIEDYSNYGLILSNDKGPGLVSTIHKKFKKVWDLYKEQRSLDWDEAEFDFSQCNLDFKNCPKDVSDMMIRTLAWQWETDSVASKAIVAIMAPFVTSNEYWFAIQRVSDNESVHALTYSEIVRLSFDDPNKVLSDILSVKESMSRLNCVRKVFAEAYEASHKYALGQIQNSQELYNIVFKFIATLYMLERIQFTASFAVTFTICGAGWFQPIGKAVQKIAQDELEVHCELGAEVLKCEMQTERGKIALEQTHSELLEIFNEIVESERVWLFDYLFADGRTLIGANAELLYQWTLFGAKVVDQLLKLKAHHKFPKHNPLPSMEKWLNMNKFQAAPQEQDLAAYKVGTVSNDDASVIFDIDF